MQDVISFFTSEKQYRLLTQPIKPRISPRSRLRTQNSTSTNVRSTRVIGAVIDLAMGGVSHGANAADVVGANTVAVSRELNSENIVRVYR